MVPLFSLGNQASSGKASLEKAILTENSKDKLVCLNRGRNSHRGKGGREGKQTCRPVLLEREDGEVCVCMHACVPACLPVCLDVYKRAGNHDHMEYRVKVSGFSGKS